MTGREASKIFLTGKDRIVSLILFYTGQQVLGPTSMLQTTGEACKRLRKLIAEPLSIEGLKKYFHFINTQAMETLDQCQGRKVLGLKEASTFTLKVIGHMIMSLEPTGEENERFRSNFKIISSSFASLPSGDSFPLRYQGHDTTTAALTWLVKFLDENPTVMEQLREELREIVANRKSGTDLTWSEDNSMPYTTKVTSSFHSSPSLLVI
ncbi:Abscisic acid 8'-hydroxylase 3 [Spatholobus suberectus]|nr:Abscisic acid 8'-hydroxylase 3 [Spatholobus suberectus]